MRAAVIGAGAWGTALADVLARGGHDVHLWARESDVVESVNATHENKRFLAGHSLTTSLRATSVMRDALADAELVIYAAPSHALRAVAKDGAAHVQRNATLTVATKGIEHGTFALMTDVVAQEVPARPVVALSGPSFAAEVAAGQPTAIVAASDDDAAARRVQQSCSLAEFRIYTHSDVKGVELGGALKNVMAIAVGVADGLGLGYNTRAALITRGLAEMARLGTAVGAQAATFAGLAGVGDLVLTCTGPLSRNRSLGVELGKGRTLAEATAGRETVAEGVPTAESAWALAQAKGIEMPIIAAVYALLFKGLSPRDALRSLMGRELRGEQG
ncbi:MAG TPA: NAD(P)H-dependent glycerol-3-phosphate dehydrogenase [Gemmatimonadaceae bacterium]|nr:NAD(P)H-dependent glycerol-3-phosphate dehydrogenase [Gemmatimonadaceae bacterium]